MYPVGEMIMEAVLGTISIFTGEFFSNLATVISSAWNAGSTRNEKLLNVAAALWSLINTFPPIVDGFTKGLPQMFDAYAKGDGKAFTEGGITLMTGVCTAVTLGLGSAALSRPKPAKNGRENLGLGGRWL